MDDREAVDTLNRMREDIRTMQDEEKVLKANLMEILETRGHLGEDKKGNVTRSLMGTHAIATLSTQEVNRVDLPEVKCILGDKCPMLETQIVDKLTFKART